MRENLSSASIDDIMQRIASFKMWYHKIQLTSEITTPGLDFDDIWQQTRDVRRSLQYGGKAVLDLGSWDGMWAFEAEALGANRVVATDCHYDEETLEKFLFVREVLKSRVVPYFNVSPYTLTDRLDIVFGNNPSNPEDALFDIVQNLGLLYHVRDPLYVLSQSRSVLKTGGHLLLETAVHLGRHGSSMVFNGADPEAEGHTGRIYHDRTTWWAPNLSALLEMLRASMFEPVMNTVAVLKQSRVRRLADGMLLPMGRVSLIAEAVGSDRVHANYFAELSRTFRNPGFKISNILRR